MISCLSEESHYRVEFEYLFVFESVVELFGQANLKSTPEVDANPSQLRARAV